MLDRFESMSEGGLVPCFEKCCTMFWALYITFEILEFFMCSGMFCEALLGPAACCVAGLGWFLTAGFTGGLGYLKFIAGIGGPCDLLGF